MAQFGKSLRLAVCLGAWILESPSTASSAEPSKNSPEATVPSAVSKALAQPPSQVRLESLRVAVQAWAAANPQGALAWTQNSTEGFEQFQLTNYILQVWTQHEPIAAATYALALPPEKRAKWESLRQVVMFWSRNDPRAALAWVQKLSPGLEQSDLLNLTVGGWASREPEAAAAFALAFPSGRDRIFLLQSALDGWRRVNPQAAWAFARSLPGDVPKPAMMHDLLASWCERDPAAALSHVNELPDLTERRSMQDWLVWRLAIQDDAAALAYARKLSGDERDSAIYKVAEALSDRDPEAAASIASEISGPQRRLWAREMLAGGQGKIAIAAAAKDPARALKLLGQIPKGNQRSNAVLFVAVEIAKQDPRAAVALADEYPEAEDSEGVRANVLRVWASNDYEGAVAWARQLPAGPLRDCVQAWLKKPDHSP